MVGSKFNFKRKIYTLLSLKDRFFGFKCVLQLTVWLIFQVSANNKPSRSLSHPIPCMHCIFAHTWLSEQNIFVNNIVETRWLFFDYSSYEWLEAGNSIQSYCLSVGFAVKRKMAATSVVVLDRGNNTTCTVNLFGKYFKINCFLSLIVTYVVKYSIHNYCFHIQSFSRITFNSFIYFRSDAGNLKNVY